MLATYRVKMDNTRKPPRNETNTLSLEKHLFRKLSSVFWKHEVVQRSDVHDIQTTTIFRPMRHIYMYTDSANIDRIDAAPVKM